MNSVHPSSSAARNGTHRAPRQRGIALVVSLVMLVLVTLLGISGMQGTNMQERMAGNQWDRNMAFQGAEAGLRVGESWLDAPGQGGAVGISRRAAAEGHDVLGADPHWDGSGAEPATADAQTEYALLAELAAQAPLANQQSPVFHIDPPAFVRLPGDINLNQAELECQRYYRVTSRSVGGTEPAVVVLHSTYIPRQSGMVTCPNE